MRSHFQRHQTRRYPPEEQFQRLRFAHFFSPCHYFSICSQRTPATTPVSQIQPDRQPTRSTIPTAAIANSFPAPNSFTTFTAFSAFTAVGCLSQLLFFFMPVSFLHLECVPLGAYCIPSGGPAFSFHLGTEWFFIHFGGPQGHRLLP